MGPFAAPPLKSFRANPLMAAVQKTKVRPILNLSSPKGRSFNDAVNPWHLQKLTMSSPRLFGESLIKMGEGAVFSKSDIQDAYKLIPNDKKQHRLYGFKWLGKFFYDKTTVFGSAAAPAWFDPLSELIVLIVCTLFKIPRKYVHRQLDDVPMVSPKNSGLTEKFYTEYRNICAKINLPLAEQCPLNEKAFGPTNTGTVLGINFNSKNLTWSLSTEKKEKLFQIIDNFTNQKTCNLKEIQKLIGKLTDFSQMCCFMKGFKYNLLSLLKKFEDKDDCKKIITANVKHDIQIWKKAIEAASFGLPIPGIVDEPPLNHLTFISDAAGASFRWIKGTKINTTKGETRGVASIGYDGDYISFLGTITWPETLLTSAVSSNGKNFASKSTTLEMIGLLIPFLSIPWKLWGRHIVLEVDNTAVQYGWQKKYCKNDPETSILIRALHIVEAFLHCRIYVQHVKRISTDMAKLADSFSREETTTAECKMKTNHLEMRKIEGAILDWLKNPLLDWDLGLKLVNEIQNVL
jgi:hypothetical protein